MKIGIVGAGLMGRLLAFSLVNSGLQVSLFDQDDSDGVNNCSMAAAGVLAPVAELAKSEPIIFNLGSDALNHHWEKIIKQLPDSVYFRREGTLVLAHPRDQAELTRFIQGISSRLDDKNIYQKLDQGSIKKLEPEVEKFSDGFYLPSEGQIDNQALLNNLRNYLLEKNVAWQSNIFVDNIQPGKINFKNNVQKFDCVFDCRGLGAKSLFKDLRGVRGELIWLHAPDVHIRRLVRFMHPRYSLYVVPRPQQIYILGASEIESEDMSPISARTVLELLSATYYLHPGFIEARLVKTVVNCRPTLPDHLPKIKYTDGLVAINGLYRHGFLIAPTLVDEVMRWLQGGISNVRYSQLWEKFHDHYSF